MGGHQPIPLGVAVGFDVWRTPDGVEGYPAEAFTWAMAAQFLLWGLGATQVVRYRRKGRARLLRDDPDLWARQSGRSVPEPP